MPTSIAGFITVMSIVLPGIALAVDTIEFDRNGNGVPDIRFVPDLDSDQSGMAIQFDNDEDGKFDFGFLSGGAVHNDGEIFAMWIDKNSNGSVQRNEIRMLPWTLPWATFPSSYSATTASNGKGTDHFFEYHPGNAVEVERDLDGNGDIEREVFPAIGEGASDVLALVDQNNDGFFDHLSFRPEIGDEVLIGFAKKQQRLLPVMHYPQ